MFDAVLAGQLGGGRQDRRVAGPRTRDGVSLVIVISPPAAS